VPQARSENDEASTDLGLERLAAVRAACATEERALIAAVERTWNDETREELDGRIHGIQIMALEIIKATPYVPPIAAMPD
jgi:hypothetical protein